MTLSAKNPMDIPESSEDMTFIAVNYPDHEVLHSFGSCVPLAYGDLDPIYLVEWVEMLNLMGVSKIVLHNDSMAARASNVARHYANLGLVEIVQVETLYNHNTEDLYMRNALLLTDCMLRNMYNMKNILVIDVDELIVPHKVYSLSEMMRHLHTVQLGRKDSLVSDNVFRNIYYIIDQEKCYFSFN